MKRASLKSIAARAGVSKTTASFVLNGKGDHHKISKSTQQRILRTAEELDYRPSFLAQTLSSGITHTLGFIWDREQAAHLLPHLMDGLERVQYRVLPGKAVGSAEKTRLIEDFMLRQTDAIVAFDDEESAQWSRVLKESEIPLLLIPALTRSSGLGQQSTLLPQLFNLLLQHHFQHHRKAIGYIGLSDTSPEPAKVFQQAYLQRFGMNGHLLQCLSNSKELPEALHRLADKQTKAVIFENPKLLLEALVYLKGHPYESLSSMAFSTLGCSTRFEWAHPQVSAADLDYSHLAQNISAWIKDRPKPTSKIQVLPASCRLYP